MAEGWLKRLCLGRQPAEDKSLEEVHEPESKDHPHHKTHSQERDHEARKVQTDEERINNAVIGGSE
ncbi:Uncharacterized protein DAT39_003222 [Clarias magur]|uniref:Uncharacterized protein n=1 Tax=Clarias magur TaxID=1594786 RepID=A0A8J4X9U0_CLAMG|nr:Uncharacterized protein DAT39_003222 [Clarias magur]